jgi:hypothetical protein
MYQQRKQPCESLLQKWQEKRELANYYFTALIRLSPDENDAGRRHQELNKKLFMARIALKHADDQLQGCYQEYGRENPNQR